MTDSVRRAATRGALGGIAFLIVGVSPIVFMEWARRAGSLGKLSVLGLLAMATLVAMVAVAAGVVLYRIGAVSTTRPADLWVASFLAFVTWTVGVLTLVPALVFLRLSDDHSLNDYGARFFLEWALVCLVVAGVSFVMGRWSLRSLVRGWSPQAVQSRH